jgi:hypothetical protein
MYIDIEIFKSKVHESKIFFICLVCKVHYSGWIVYFSAGQEQHSFKLIARH